MHQYCTRPEVFCKKGNVEKFPKLTRKHLQGYVTFFEKGLDSYSLEHPDRLLQLL